MTNRCGLSACIAKPPVCDYFLIAAPAQRRSSTFAFIRLAHVVVVEATGVTKIMPTLFNTAAASPNGYWSRDVLSESVK